MEMFLEALKALFIGIVEGITEWLPISSTGHMILVDEFVKLDVSPEFLALFLVVIQLGAIMAVVILYFNKLNPFARNKTPEQKRGTWRIWGMVAIGSIPAAIVGLTLDDWVNEHFYNANTVATTLIVYGVIFIIMEAINRKRERAAREALSGAGAGGAGAPGVEPVRGKHARVEDAAVLAQADAAEQELGPNAIFRIKEVDDIDWKTALKIGLFQCLAVIPGTSRSGSTIIGGMLFGCSRTAAAEFTFFLAIPIMFGWGVVKAAKFFLAGMAMTTTEILVLVVGIVSAFVMSVLAIRFLMGYIKQNDFTAFGVYRIFVGVVVLGYFGLKGMGML